MATKNTTTNVSSPLELLDDLLSSSGTFPHVREHRTQLVACSCGCLQIVPYEQAVWKEDDDGNKYGRQAFADYTHMERYFRRRELEASFGDGEEY